LSYTLGQKQLDSIEDTLLAALAAGNFGAVSAMAKIIGENEFSLLEYPFQ